MLSIPPQSLRVSLATWTPHIGPDNVIISLMKGTETDTGKRASEIIAEVTDVDTDRIAVLPGPNLAREIMAGQPAACPDENAARRFQTACHTANFRPALHQHRRDRLRVGRRVKNVIALATGIALGMGLGHSAAAVLITHGLTETTRLATVLSADPATLAGLSGLGDLVATCTSPRSSNRTFGTYLGQGMSVAQVTAAPQQTTEGVKSAEAILELALAHGVEMPITETIAALLHAKVSLDQATAALLERPTKPERCPHARRGRPSPSRSRRPVMPESVLSAAQLTITGTLVVWMITGFTRLPCRWLRWKMFCRANLMSTDVSEAGEGAH